MPLSNDVSELLRAAGAPDATTETVDVLRSRREELGPVLGCDDLRVEVPWIDVDAPGTVATLLRALTRAFPEWADRPEPETCDPFRSLRDDEHAAIGRWYGEVLIPALDGRPTLATALSGTPTVAADVFRHLAAEPSVVAGGPHALDLARHGLTPVDVVEVAGAIGCLAARLADAVPGTVGVLAWADASVDRLIPLSSHGAIREVAMTLYTSDEVAEVVAHWVVHVATIASPLLIRGFKTTRTASGTVLRPTEETIDWFREAP